MDFFRNLWKNSPNLVRYLCLTAIVIVFLKVSTQPKTPNVRKMIAEQEKVMKLEVVPLKEKKMTFKEEIEYMKKCGRQLRVNRVNWYLDEKGITDNFERIKIIETTDLFDSSKPYELMESYKARGIQPKTGRDLPYVNCAPDARDKLPANFF